jgi:hypothetical protein
VTPSAKLRRHCNPQQEFRRSDLHEGVREKKTDSLRLLIVVGGHGAFVAAFRNRADRWWHFCRNGVATVVTPLPVQWAGERVGDEATDGLRLLLVVGA